MAESLLEMARENAEAEGSLGITGLAERYFAHANSDPQRRERLGAKRADGVNDDDIRWWWNMEGLERHAMLLMDQQTRLGMFLGYTKNRGLADEQAAKEINRRQPLYSDSEDPKHPTGEDRPLPYELKDRINKWTQRNQGDPEAFKGRLASASSMNALIRQEIGAGNL